jgi:hypothetical protein
MSCFPQKKSRLASRGVGNGGKRGLIGEGLCARKAKR